MRITTVAWQSMQAAIHAMEAAIRAIAASITRDGVCVVDPHYKLGTVVKDTPFAGVNGATIGGDGALYVVHSGDGTATRIDLETHGGDRARAPLGRGVSLRRHHQRRQGHVLCDRHDAAGRRGTGSTPPA